MRDMPMNDASLVQVFQTQGDLRDVVLGPLLWQAPQRLDQRGTITSIGVLHDEIQIVLALECEVELRDERRLSLLHQNHPLRLDVGDLVLRNHVGLLQDLDSEVVASDLLLSEED